MTIYILPEDPSYKEARQTRDVAHELHHKKGKHLILGLHLARRHRVTVPVSVVSKVKTLCQLLFDES